MSLRRLLFENLSLKLIALVLSLVLFLVVRGEERSTLTVDVPLLLRVPAGYVVVNEPAETVSVELHGRYSQLKNLQLEELGPISIVPAASGGRTTITLKPEFLTLPPGLTVERFDPPSIPVTLEERSTRRVPVVAERALRGEPPPGHQVGEVRATPAEVEISGPRSVVEMVSQVTVEPIELNGHTSRLVTRRHVVSDRRSIKIEGDPEIEIAIDIVPREQERLLEDVPVHMLDLSAPHEVVPRRVDLVLLGEEEALAQVDPQAVYVAFPVDAPLREPGRSSQLVITLDSVHNLPPGVVIDTVRAPSVVLWVLPEPAPLRPLETLHEPPGLPSEGATPPP